MQSADGTQAREFLQDEIEIRRGATFATVQFGAALTAAFDWLPAIGPSRYVRLPGHDSPSGCSVVLRVACIS